MDSDIWLEKRQHPRAHFDWPVTIIGEQGTTIFGRVKDISRGGVLVHVETILQINEQVQLAIEIPNFDDVISATGKIVRVLSPDEQNSSTIYGLSILFTEISTEDCRYFTGNLAPEWQEPAPGKERPEWLNIPDQLETRQRRVTKTLRWVIGGICVAGLALAALVFFQPSPPKPSVVPEPAVLKEDLLQLSARTVEEIESIRNSQQQQATAVSQIEKRLLELETKAVPSDQIEEIRGQLKFLTQEMRQVKITLLKQQETKNKIPVVTPAKKTSKPKESVVYHTVSKGETLYSISKQYGLTVEELLKINNLGRGTIIHSSQKLRIKLSSSN